MQTTLIARKGRRVKKNFVGKKDVYERYLLRADLANQSSEENATGTSTSGVLCPVHSFMGSLNISRRGLSRVAYPEQGNARARTWDKREVEHPRLSV